MKKFSDGMYLIDPSTFPECFKALGKGTVVTHGYYLNDSLGTKEDHAWNHLDLDHRPHIHRTYQESVRLSRGKNFALSLTKFKVGPLKLSMLVTDIQVSPTLCYQTYSIFNLLSLHSFTHFLDKKVRADWYIVSHWAFKFLHPLINWRLTRLILIQEKEDQVIIRQRVLLRSRGYKFNTDTPDYLNSNQNDNGVIAPEIQGVVTFNTTDLSEQTRTKVTKNSLELLVEKKAGELSVWPNICPHQGASLEGGTACGKKIECPWHGLKISGVTLTKNKNEAILGNLTLTWNGTVLTVVQAERIKEIRIAS